MLMDASIGGAFPTHHPAELDLLQWPKVFLRLIEQPDNATRGHALPVDGDRHSSGRGDIGAARLFKDPPFTLPLALWRRFRVDRTFPHQGR